MSRCVSDLALEQFLLDEITLEEREHIVGCVRCRAQLSWKRRAGTAYLNSRAASHLATLLGEADQIAASIHARTRKLVVAAIAVAAALLVVALLPGRTTLAEAEIVAVEQAWMNAYVANDVAALDSILADDYQATDASGKVRTKADDLERAKSKTLHFDVYDTTNVRVRVWGDTAVVTGQSALRGSHGGKPFASNIVFTDTLTRIDGRWRAVSAHVTHLD